MKVTFPRICAAFVFLAFISYFATWHLTLFGQDGLQISLVASAVLGVVVAAVAYFIVDQAVARSEHLREKVSAYKGGKFNVVGGMVIAALASLIGFAAASSVASEKMGVAEVEKQKAAVLAKNEKVEELKAAAKKEAELARLAALTPAQRVAEERATKEKTAAVEAKRAAAVAKAAAEKARLEKLVAQFGKAPAQSESDGYCPAVERYLKREMNDPDSLKMAGCTKAELTDKGWVVGCMYRGRNALGGMVKESKWFTIQQGTVVSARDE